MDVFATPDVRRAPHELTRFRTDTIDAWGATVSEKIIALRPDTRVSIDRFEGSVVIARFHKSVVADVRSTAHRVMRNRELAARDEHRYCKIVWQLDGATQLEQKRGTARIRPGEWAVYDTSLPYTFEVCGTEQESARFLVLLLPLDEFGDYASDVDRIAGKALPGRGTAEVARAALTGVLAGGIALEAEGQRVLQDSILALMGNAIRTVDDASKDAVRASHRKLQAAQAYIERNLSEDTLSPENVAQACGMSRRSLYDAFNALDQTPHAYIQRRRLAKACELLGDSAGPHTITQIAYELGFADAAHFSRLFNERYGVSPSQWRKTQG